MHKGAGMEEGTFLYSEQSRAVCLCFYISLYDKQIQLFCKCSLMFSAQKYCQSAPLDWTAKKSIEEWAKSHPSTPCHSCRQSKYKVRRYIIMKALHKTPVDLSLSDSTYHSVVEDEFNFNSWIAPTVPAVIRLLLGFCPFSFATILNCGYQIPQNGIWAWQVHSHLPVDITQLMQHNINTVNHGRTDLLTAFFIIM